MTVGSPAGLAAEGTGALSIRSVSKAYGAHVALDDISLNVERGKFVTLLGPSGSGKTTLLMSVAGFVSLTGGAIVLDGRDITRLPPERRNFGMVFQGYALFPNMTVEENVWFPLRVRGVSRSEARERVRSSLDMVQMAQFAGRLPSQLSGGQQQRVALARALVFQPSLLLLDEPLSALDRRLRAELQWELRSLHRRLGVTFIYVTHDQDEALSMSDEIVILRSGRIEQIGTPTELYSRPESSFVASFLGDSNFIRGRVGAVHQDRFILSAGESEIVQAGRPPLESAEGMAVLAIRPEKLVVAENRPDTTNAVEGRVAEAQYQGATHQVHIQSPSLGMLTVRLPLKEGTGEIGVGSRVWVGWNAEDAVPVREA